MQALAIAAVIDIELAPRLDVATSDENGERALCLPEGRISLLASASYKLASVVHRLRFGFCCSALMAS